MAVSTDDQEHVPSVTGPMSRCIGSLVHVTKAVTEAAPRDFDPKCTPLPWRSTMYGDAQSRPLRIAIMREEAVVRPHPSVARVLADVSPKLERAGHEVVAWNPGSLHQDCIDIMDQHYTADGDEEIRRDVKAGNEP